VSDTILKSLHEDVVASWKEENERLQAELEQAKAERDAVADEVIKMDAENEELQSDLSVARQSLYKATEQRNQYASNNARLREALEKNVEMYKNLGPVCAQAMADNSEEALNVNK